MIVEERNYTLKPGKAGEFMALYQKKGLQIQTRILGNLIGYFLSEIGDLNVAVHLWGYESLEERTRRRGLLIQEQVWRDYIAAVTPLIDRMSNRILLPTAFSPIH
ncbi:NIPSNAP family protein [Ferrovibrio sp.]|uniref:NIPSNAP family protein n=1 Tax=Ferrovibrio sp. TaxID=1917215 RepID=UPI0035B01A86